MVRYVSTSFVGDCSFTSLPLRTLLLYCIDYNLNHVKYIELRYKSVPLQQFQVIQIDKCFFR